MLLERGHDFRLSPRQADVPWSFDDDEEMGRRYPRLTKIF